MSGISKSNMDRLWSKAVKVIHGNTCAICGAWGPMEAHHIIKRSKLVTRWDWRNGVCLCVRCHAKAEQLQTRIQISQIHPHMAYLAEREHVLLKNFNAEYGLTRDEFALNKKAELEAVIKRYRDKE